MSTRHEVPMYGDFSTCWIAGLMISALSSSLSDAFGIRLILSTNLVIHVCVAIWNMQKSLHFFVGDHSY